MQIALALVAAAAAGGGIGWYAHRTGELGRKDAHEAYCREMSNAAGTARDRARSERDEFEEKLNALRTEHQACDSTIKSLRSRLATFDISKVESGERIEALQRSLSDLEPQLEKAEADRSMLRKALRQRETSIRSIEGNLVAARSAADDSGSTVERQQDEIRQLRHEAEEIRTTHTDCGARIRELETLLEKSTHLRQQLSDRERSLTKSESEVKTLRASCAELQRRSEERAGAVRALEAELAHARDSHADCGRKATADEARIEELESLLEEQDRARAEGKPTWLLTAAQGDPDDLKLIKGVGPVLERRLHDLGVFHYRQLALLTAAETEWIAPRLRVTTEKIVREQWATQAWQHLSGDQAATGDDAG